MPGPLLPLNGGTLAVLAVPTIIKTFFRHFRHKDDVLEESLARGEMTFDQAFSLVKMFFEVATSYCVEDVQRFGNTYVPAPWWVRVVRVVVPQETCSDAGKILIKAFGEDEIRGVVGGEQWWQRRGQKDGGIEGEWIAMKTDWKNVKTRDDMSRDRRRRGGRPRGSSKSGRSDTEEKSEKERLKTARKDFDRAKDEEKSRTKQARKAQKDARKDDDASTAAGTANSTRPSSRSAGRVLNDEGEYETADENEEDGRMGPDRRSKAEKEADETYSEEMDDMRCMLYIHGGGYYFGSINTHRYTIWRYCRKMAGRAFAINYRLAPQYPFPCALADCLASYLYLIRPPKEAKHRPVDPSKLIIAGDSAGGGLALSLLLIIRDMGLPAPAGGVLISPWVDLTHSFPSVMQNTKTDIIPPYGFMHQPSALWPPPSAEFAEKSRTRLKTGKDGKIMRTPTPTTRSRKTSKQSKGSTENGGPATEQPSHPSVAGEDAQKVEANGDAKHNGDAKPWVNPYIPKPGGKGMSIKDGPESETGLEPAKILQLEVDGKQVEIAEQIQLCATNDQLTHPLCSPALAASLGGLPKLFIIAGDKEVLRDEILYVAHRAAHPDKYPLREELLNANPERAAQAKKYGPTEVHLQVYDGMCHVLPLFSFTTPARYCYRAIASFCKYVTTEHAGVASPVSADGLALPPTAATLQGSAPIQRTDSPAESFAAMSAVTTRDTRTGSAPAATSGEGPASTSRRNSLKVPTPASTTQPSEKRQASKSVSGTADAHGEAAGSLRTTLNVKTLQELRSTIYHSTQPFNRPSYRDNMIRERISVQGRVRQLEPEEELQGCQLKPEEVGVIKAAPIHRWLEGKSKWDSRFGKKYAKIARARERTVKRSNLEEEQRLRHRLKNRGREPTRKFDGDFPQTDSPANEPGAFMSSHLEGEHPPPSSIASRRDTKEALTLAHAVDHQQHSVKVPHALAMWTRFMDRGGKPQFVDEESDDVAKPKQRLSWSEERNAA